MKRFRCLVVAAWSLSLALISLPASAQRAITNPAAVRRLETSAHNPPLPTGFPLRFDTGNRLATGGTSPHGVATGDFNRDGKQDIVVVNQDQDNVAVLLGNGDGTFAAPVTYSLPAGVPMQVAVADFNGDGNPDIAVVTGQVNGFTSNVFVLLGNGDGTFSTAITTAPGVNGLTIHAADVNGDGKQDVVIGGADNAAVLYGKGDGTFQTPVVLRSVGPLVDAAVGDVNGDGRLDLVCAISSPASGIAVFLQNADGSFSHGQILPLATPLTTSGISLGDFNHDGKLDALLVTLYPIGGNSFTFLGNGDGTFQSPLSGFAGESPRYAAIADFNRDGVPDAAFANFTNQNYEPNLYILSGLGDGTFTFLNSEFQYTSGNTIGVAVADFNNDGWPDVVTVDQTGSTVTVFLNLIPAMQGPQRFVPIAPCRLIDTRSGLGGILGPVGGPVIFEWGFSGSGTCGPTLAPNASAYSMNFTVLPLEPFPYLEVWQQGGPLSDVSILNSPDGRARANALVVPAGNNGGLDIYFPHSSTNLLIDVNGYFVPASQSSLAFYPVTPCRVFDTRNANGPLGGPNLYPGQVRDFPVLDSNCNIPSDAQAYSMNFTAVPYEGQDLSYLTVWAKGFAQPGVSTLNNPAATIVANGAVVQAGTDGQISVYASDNTQLVGDINGYFAPAQPGGLSLYALQPCRAFDTRQQNGAFEGELTVNIAASPCAPSISAQAYAMNATVVPDSMLNYLTLWPDGQGRPTVSTLNAVDGQITSNMAIVGTTNGEIDAYASGLTNLILDLYGYFAP